MPSTALGVCALESLSSTEKIKSTADAVLLFLAERKGFEPLKEFKSLHDFQSCALDQLSHLSEWNCLPTILHDLERKCKNFFQKLHINFLLAGKSVDHTALYRLIQQFFQRLGIQAQLQSIPLLIIGFVAVAVGFIIN